MNPSKDAARSREAGGLGAGSDPVSRPELRRLEAQRRAAAPLRDLTPPGLQQQASALDIRQRENRVRHIENRLNETKGLAAIEFALGQQRGVAKDGFERSR